MQQYFRVSPPSVHQMVLTLERLAENDLKPWRRDMWCVPQVDGEYVARMEDVLDLYIWGDPSVAGQNRLIASRGHD